MSQLCRIAYEEECKFTILCQMYSSHCDLKYSDISKAVQYHTCTRVMRDNSVHVCLMIPR